jgi:maltose O-acetyltransferase
MDGNSGRGSRNQVIKAAYLLSDGLDGDIFNWLLNLLPDNLFIDAYVRPMIARTMGMKCERTTRIKRGVYIEYHRRLVLGDGVVLNKHLFIDGYGGIKIGNNVRLGPQVTMITGSHEIGGPEMRTGATISAPIVIEEGCWIGARVIIFPGVTIGKGSVVSAGSVVQRSMPGGYLISGHPARPISMLPGESHPGD